MELVEQSDSLNLVKLVVKLILVIITYFEISTTLRFYLVFVMFR